MATKNKAIKKRQKKRRKLREREQKWNVRYAQDHKCPTPNKKPYDTKQQAENARFSQVSSCQPGRNFAVRSYECPCGKYHISSKPSKK